MSFVLTGFPKTNGDFGDGRVSKGRGGIDIDSGPPAAPVPREATSAHRGRHLIAASLV